MKKLVYIGLFMCLGAGLPPVRGQVPKDSPNVEQKDSSQVKYLTLEACVSEAIKNNIDIKTARTQAAIAGVYLNQARMEQLPSVSGYIGHGLNSGRSINPSDNSYITQSFTSADYSLSANLSLFNGFKIRNYIRKSKLDKEAGELDAQQQKDAITIQVIAAYLEVLNQQEILNNYYQQLLTTQVQYNRLDTLNQSGAANPDDFYDMKGQLSSGELAITSQQNVIRSAKITLFELMNEPLNMDVVLQDPGTATGENIPADKSIDGIYAKALSILPNVRAADLKYQSAIKNVAVEKADYYPSLSLNAGIGTAFSSAATRSIVGEMVTSETGDYVMSGSDKLPVYSNSNAMSYRDIPYWNQLKNNYGTNVNLTLNIPIFNKLQSRTDVKVAQLQEKLAKDQLTTSQTSLKNAIGKSYYDQQTAMEAWLKQQDLVAAYREYFRISEVKFNAGAINSADYLIAKNKLSQAEISLVAAKYNYLFKTKILSYYEGTLSL
jgi:outer membrane protein